MPENKVKSFFEAYGKTLMSRDAKAIAAMYSSPCFIVFPGQLMAVTKPADTVKFFSQSMGQYEGITSLKSKVKVVPANTDGIYWADVTWLHGRSGGKEKPGEAMRYQLIELDGTLKICSLSPLKSG